ncbi:MAG TPA: thiamine phosphate synthase [Vicinamibacterales bacterium]
MHLPALYAIVDAEVANRRGWTVPELARAYLAGGARLLQVRAKRAGGAEFLEWCEAVVADARALGATVIVNDRADVAAMAGADGVHLGQNDLGVSDVRRVYPSIRVVGLSTHSEQQIAAAFEQPASYTAVGPIFATRTKATGYDAVGLHLVRSAVAAARSRGEGGIGRPIVAIGGITLERAERVLSAGAHSVAVISDLLSTGDPEARVRAYVERLTTA